MARVTSKRQVTIPKTIADRYGIASGDEIEFLPAGDAILVRRRAVRSTSLAADQRVELFDRATARQKARQKSKQASAGSTRDWRRDDLYERGSPR